MTRKNLVFVILKKIGNDFYLTTTALDRKIGNIYCLSADFLKVALERIGADKLKKLFKEE